MRSLTIVAAALLLAAPQLAGGQPYVSAQLGLASTDWPRGAPLNGRIDDRAAGYGIDVGIGFGKRWAFELGAYGYGGFDASGTPCAAGAACPEVVTEISSNDVTILKAALAPRFVVGKVRLFATFGYYQATIDANLDLPDAKQRDSGALLGAGARWYFRDPWSVSVQATRFDDNLRQLTLGVGWGMRPDRTDED
jgi:Outer membrane protein beta-barrel domain